MRSESYDTKLRMLANQIGILDYIGQSDQTTQIEAANTIEAITSFDFGTQTTLQKKTSGCSEFTPATSKERIGITFNKELL